VNIGVLARYALLWALKEDDQPLYQLYWEVRSSGAERSGRDVLATTKETIRWLVRSGYANLSELTTDGWRELEPADSRFVRLFDAPASWEPEENGDRNRVALTERGVNALSSGEWASDFDADELLNSFSSAQTEGERWAYAGALAATADARFADRLLETAFDPDSGRAGGSLMITAARAAGNRVRARIERTISEPRLEFLARKALGELDEVGH
jgi:hypothetical protein